LASNKKTQPAISLSGIAGGCTSVERVTVNRIIRSANQLWQRTPAAEVTANFVSAPVIQQLNRQYRRVNRPTTTLSFVYQGSGSQRDPWIGEIMFCRRAIKQWAEDSGKTYLIALADLTAHSLLHILGYHHQNDTQERTMERWAKRITKSIT
jgi:probable rRNA maturation factor